MKISSKLNSILVAVQKSDGVYSLLVSELKSNSINMEYLDYTYVGKKLTFTVLPKNAIKDDMPNVYDSTLRQSVNLGRILNKTSPLIGEDTKRSFIETVAAKIREEYGEYKLEVVSGETIRESYHPNNIAPPSDECNIQSCMVYEQYQLNLDFYVYNPDVIQMLRMTVDNKVAGRALIYTAYRSVEDLIAGYNPNILLGRYYTAKKSASVLFDEWAKTNADWKLQGQEVRNFSNEDHLWLWYIPLKHWDLNYYPYMDHFAYLYKNIVPDFGIWTNDKSYSKSHKWIRPARDNHEDSEGKVTKLDPFRPNKVYLAESHEWVDKGDLVMAEGRWVRKADTLECDYCHSLALIKSIRTLSDKRKVCGAHAAVGLADGTIALQDEAAQCKDCKLWHLPLNIKDSLCERCLNKYKICPRCESKVDSNFFFTVTDEISIDICALCADKANYLRCDDCFLIKTGVVHDNKTWLCVECTKKLKGDTTNEKYASDSVDLTISPNAMRITVAS